jgi:hypothetical protein
MFVTKTLAPVVGFPYLGASELKGRLPYAINRDFFICAHPVSICSGVSKHQDVRTHPEFDFAQSGGYPRGPRGSFRPGTTLGIFIFRRKNMSSITNEVKASSKTTLTPIDLLETLQEKNFALRAFSVLLGTARLSDFDSEQYPKHSKGWAETENLQTGLSKLLDLYITDLEQTVDEFAFEYGQSDLWKLQWASDLIRQTKEGAWTTPHIPRNQFSQAMDGLETVIDNDAGFKPMAEALRISIMKYAPPLSNRDNTKGGE